MIVTILYFDTTQNGLKLILDLHSNKESFGTVQSDWSGFQVNNILIRIQRLEGSSDLRVTASLA